MNHVVLSLLKEAVGVSNGRHSHKKFFNDLDHLAGTWSQKEAKAFEEELEHQRTIDEQMWQ
jgi:hypothetical protein